MSDTPRTKDATFQVRSRGTPVPDDVTYASFTAGLELELAAANARIRRLEEVQEAGLALMNAVAPFSLNPDEEGDDETTIRQCQPDTVIGWEEPPTAKEHIKLYDATIAFGRAAIEAKETRP
jgi:hypothetical protein